MSQKKRKRLTEYFGGYIEGKLCDLVRDEDGYILFQLVGETVELKSELILDDKVLIPPVKVPWNVPPPITQEDIDNYDPNRYLKEIKDYLHKYVEFPRESQYDLLGMWVMATWVKDIFPVYSYLHMRGPKSCGKSKVLEVLAPICYRGVLTASPSEATMFREIEGKGVTYFIDDLEQEDIDKRNLLGLLDSGYRKGWLYSRCSSTEDRTVEYFNVSGFKAFSSRDDFKDVLESRCIPIHMTKTKRKVPLWIEESDSLKVLKLGSVTKSVIFQTAIKKAQKKYEMTDKNTLISDTTASCDTLLYNNIYNIYNNNVYYDIYVIDNILVQCRTEELFAYTLILASLLSQAVQAITFEVPKCVTEIVVKASQEKLEEDTLGEEATLLEVVVEILTCHGWGVHLTVADISESLHREVSNRKDMWSDRKIAQLLKRIGFVQKRTGRKRYYVIEKDYLKKCLGDFGVEYPPDLFKDSFEAAGTCTGTITTDPPQKKPKVIRMYDLVDVIEDIKKTSENSLASFDAILERTGMGKGELELALEDLKKKGVIYEPKVGSFEVI